MTRRGFIGRMLAGAATSMAPARWLVLALPAIPILYGDGKHDDTAALNAWGAGRAVKRPDGTMLGERLENGHFLVSDVVNISRQDGVWIVNNYFRCTPEYQERLRVESQAMLRATLPEAG